MLEIVGDKNADWFETWKASPEAQGVQVELDRIHKEMESAGNSDDDPSAHKEFAVPFTTQLSVVTTRVFQQYWRMPAYIFAKFALGIASGLFIGFSCKSCSTQRIRSMLTNT